MNAGWLVYSLTTSILVGLAALALERVARTYRWPTRWIWTLALLATALLVAGPGLIRQDAAANFTASVSASAAGTPSSDATTGSMIADIRAIAGSVLAAWASAAAGRLPNWLAASMGALWLGSALAALAAIALVHARLHRARRSWPSAELHGRRVRIAPRIGPAVVGIVRPEIVVPQWLLERGRDEQRLVLAHEEEHVHARDHLLLGGACVAVALMPWHPLAWWSLGRLRLAIELDCDARVLRRGVAARSYGEMLIDLAGQCSGFRVGATALADQNSHLERRLLAMRPITTRPSAFRAAASLAAAALLLLAACDARVPTSAEIQKLDVAGAERVVARTGLMRAMHGTAPEFYVNDVKVTAAEAHAIAPNDIATIDVRKGEGGSAASVIRITTNATSTDGSKFRVAGPTAKIESPGRLRTMHDKMTASGHAFSGVVVIDGVRATAEALHRLDPQKIAGVEVVKGAAAVRFSNDPAAKNGVISVTTKGR